MPKESMARGVASERRVVTSTFSTESKPPASSMQQQNNAATTSANNNNANFNTIARTPSSNAIPTTASSNNTTNTTSNSSTSTSTTASTADANQLKQLNDELAKCRAELKETDKNFTQMQGEFENTQLLYMAEKEKTERLMDALRKAQTAATTSTSSTTTSTTTSNNNSARSAADEQLIFDLRAQVGSLTLQLSALQSNGANAAVEEEGGLSAIEAAVLRTEVIFVYFISFFDFDCVIV